MRPPSLYTGCWRWNARLVFHIFHPSATYLIYHIFWILFIPFKIYSIQHIFHSPYIKYTRYSMHHIFHTIDIPYAIDLIWNISIYHMFNIFHSYIILSITLYSIWISTYHTQLYQIIYFIKAQMQVLNRKRVTYIIMWSYFKSYQIS